MCIIMVFLSHFVKDSYLATAEQLVLYLIVIKTGTFQIKIKSDKLMQCVGVAAGLGARRDRGRGVHADVLFDDSDDSGSVFDSSSDDSDSDDDSDDDHFDSRHDFASEIRGMYVP